MDSDWHGFERRFAKIFNEMSGDVAFWIADESRLPWLVGATVSDDESFEGRRFFEMVVVHPPAGPDKASVKVIHYARLAARTFHDPKRVLLLDYAVGCGSLDENGLDGEWTAVTRDVKRRIPQVISLMPEFGHTSLIHRDEAERSLISLVHTLETFEDVYTVLD